MPTPEVKAVLESLVKHQCQELIFVINEAIVNVDTPTELKFDVRDALEIVMDIESHLFKIHQGVI